MRAQVLLDFIRALQHDEPHREARRDFHEGYEWIEGYSRQHPELGSMERFCNRFGDYYWRIGEFRDLAWELGRQGCVGNSLDDNYFPAPQVIRATMYLLHRTVIGEGRDVNECSDMDCVRARYGLELCDVHQRAREWTGSEFEAAMGIIRQIRNNLFHGRKLELMDRQYERNRQLVTTAARITTLLLDHLVEVERQSI